MTHNEVLKLDEVLKNCILLFENNVDSIRYKLEPDVRVRADREQLRRVFVNLLKNAEQSIPAGQQGEITVTLQTVGTRAEVAEHSCRTAGRNHSDFAVSRYAGRGAGQGQRLRHSGRHPEKDIRAKLYNQIQRFGLGLSDLPAHH